MRVLMFGWEFPPFITGGLGTACHGLSTTLAPLVEKITFVLPKIKGASDTGGVELMSARDIPLPAAPELDEFATQIEMMTIQSSLRPYLTEWEYSDQMQRLAAEREAGRRGEGTPASGRIASAAAPGHYEFTGGYGKNLYEEVARYAAIASRAVLGQSYDVIHAHDWMTFLAGVEAKRLSGLPLVVHVHATEFDRSGDSVNQQVYDLERYGMEHADRVIAVSQRTKDICCERYGIDPAKVHVVYNGVMPAPEKRLPERRLVKKIPGKMVVFLGRITQQKGPQYFLEAAYLVAKKLPDTRFVMAGSGDMLPQMIDRMAALGLLDRFYFTGFIDEARRDILLSQADLMVMPSVSEPFGISPVEAIQYGVPVIVTKQSGVAEVLRHAIKVDFWDVRRIADAMIKVIGTDGLSHQLIEGGLEDLAAITWQKAATRVKQIYEEMRP